MIRDSLSSSLHGHVTVTVDGVDYSEKNLVVHSGADVLAALLAGNNDYRITYAYIEYENTVGAPTPLPIDRANNTAELHGMTAPQDFLRAPLSALPMRSPTSADYTGNQVTFHATSSSTAGTINALSFGAAANSQVIAVSLIASPGSGFSQDVLYARHVLASPQSVTGLGQVSVTWQTEIL